MRVLAVALAVLLLAVLGGAALGVDPLGLLDRADDAEEQAGLRTEPGHGDEAAPQPTLKGRPPPELPLARGTGGIHGVVRDARTGAPVAGATVHVLRCPPNCFVPYSVATTTSDVDGAYHLGDLPHVGEILAVVACGVGWVSERALDPDSWAFQERRWRAGLRRGVWVPHDLAVMRGARLEGEIRRPDGTPAGGASVFVDWNGGPDATHHGFPWSAVPEATADAAGRFVLDGLPPARGRTVAAYLDGYVRTESDPFDLALDGVAYVSFAFTDHRRIRVRVVDARSGKRIRDAVVEVPEVDRDKPFGDRVAELVVPPKDVRLEVTAPAYRPYVSHGDAWDDVLRPDGQGGGQGEVRLEPEALVHGRVVCPDGLPPSGVTVRVETLGDPWGAYAVGGLTSADGAFQIPVPKGARYAVRVDSDPIGRGFYASTPVEADADGAAVVVHARLVPVEDRDDTEESSPPEVEADPLAGGEGRVAGWVVDEEGRPVPGAEIRAKPPDVEDGPWIWDDRPVGVSDADGRFAVEGLGDTEVDLHCLAWPEFALPGLVRASVGDEAVRITLHRTVAVRIRALLPDGRPAVYAEVKVYPSGGERTQVQFQWFWHKRRFGTDEDGEAHVKGLDPEARYTLRVAGPYQTFLADVRVEDWKPEDTEVRFHGSGRVVGHVVDGAGRELPRLRVWARDRTGEVHEDWTDDAGFHLYGLPAGRVELGATFGPKPETWEGFFTAEAEVGDEDVVLRVESGRTLTITFPEEERSLERWQDLRLTPVDDVGAARELWKVDDGVYRVGGLDPDMSYWLWMGPTDTGRYAYAEVAPGVEEVTLRFQRCGTIQGRVDLPAEHGRVLARIAQRGVRIEAEARSDGSFTLIGVPPGSWTVRVETTLPGGATAWGHADAMPGESVHVLLAE